MGRIETFRWRSRAVDFALATVAALVLWGGGLGEIAWLPFVSIAI